MISIAENNLCAQFFQRVLRYTFHRTQRAHRHKYRGFNDAVGRGELAKTGGASLGLNGEGQGHRSSKAQTGFWLLAPGGAALSR